jgi:hypothetical protein
MKAPSSSSSSSFSQCELAREEKKFQVKLFKMVLMSNRMNDFHIFPPLTLFICVSPSLLLRERNFLCRRRFC